MHFELILILVSSLILGLLSALFGWALDFAMDYGHLLYKVRYNRAKSSAKAQGLSDWFEKESNKAKDLPFGERITAFDSVYWSLTKKDFGFTTWVCVVCLTSRVSLVIGLIGLTALTLSGLIEWWSVIIGIAPVLLFSFLSIKLLIKI